jgi:hypothetical protein
MEVTFAGPAPPDGTPLPGVLSVAKEGRTWRLLVRGEITPLLRELARYDLEDLVYEQARLEDIFLEYYREGVTG